MAKNIKIKEMDMASLIAYGEAINLVVDYYENLAQAHTGTYDDYSDKIREDATTKRGRYIKISEKLFKEIENKVNDLDIAQE